MRLGELGIRDSGSVMDIASLAPSYAFEFEGLATVVKTILSSEHRMIPIVSKVHDLVGFISYLDILGALLRGESRNVRISEFMTRQVIYCESSESIRYVLQKMKIARHDGMPVVKGTKLTGMVSEHDFVNLIVGKYLDIPVYDAMSHKPLFISPEMTVAVCMKTMVNTQYHRLPVVQKNELVGMITGNEILRHLDENNYSTIRANEKIEDIMASPAIHVNRHDDVSDAVKTMINHRIGGVPVIDENNRPIGILTERDVVELL